MVNFIPAKDSILVLEDTEKANKDGIIVSAKTHRVGKVIAVGPGRLTEYGNIHPVSVAVGQTVAFTEFCGVKMDLEGTKYVLITDNDILGTINEEQE